MKKTNYKHVWVSLLSLLLAVLLLLPAGTVLADGEEDKVVTEILDELTGATLGVIDPDAQSLHLQTVANTWQLGGYETEDGRKIKNNVLMRGATLYGASEEDLQKLSEEYHLTKIVDFRSPSEAAMKPDPEVAGAEYISISLEDKSQQKEGDSEAMMAIMQEYADEPGRSDLELIRAGLGGPKPEMYINMINGEVQVTGFRALIDLLLAAEEDDVILWHCSSGKDRTGGFTTVLLTLLGVDKDMIFADFGLTNVNKADDIKAAIVQGMQYTDDPDELYLLGANVGVCLKYLQNAYDFAEEEAGSMLEFIKQRYNITDEEIQILRDKYLTD